MGSVVALSEVRRLGVDPIPSGDVEADSLLDLELVPRPRNLAKSLLPISIVLRRVRERKFFKARSLRMVALAAIYE